MALTRFHLHRPWYAFVALVPLWLVASGCGSDIDKRACMTVGGPGPLVAGAVAFRLDVYDGQVACAGSSIAPGSGPPSLTRTYVRDQRIELQVAAGTHALVLTTFSDADATQPLGAGCLVAQVSPGAQLCFELTIAPLSDLAGFDGGVGDGGGNGDGGVTPSRCESPNGYLLCDGFEGGTLDPRWSRYTGAGSAGVDDTRAFRGSGSLHAHLDSASGGNGSHGTVYTALDYPYPDLYVRAFVFVPSLTTPLVALMTMVQYDFPFSSMQLDLENGSFSVYDSIEDSHSSSLAQMPTNRWFCLEWQVHFNPTSGYTLLWLDGTQVLSSNTMNTDPDPFYYYLRIGLEATISNSTDVWIDELVADDRPIGCDG